MLSLTWEYALNSLHGYLMVLFFYSACNMSNEVGSALQNGGRDSSFCHSYPNLHVGHVVYTGSAICERRIM